ncbi:glutathione S-transferase family protein [Hyphomonas johnsonii]|uniref:Glutathione S-transferase n=1 Tax=Hyphomonas johnsonii MHS-2 TaxID=1280950 RepID=A0A059FPB5_9PROT|nr:glutathione S-transferase family protein [Hyphomonas johnsonii]KCZ92313.1 glutathione S-transferase [Hyphomonas johnsonii MHS-2]
MILYDYPSGPNPRRVRIYLAEKGLHVPTETVDILARRNRQPDFLEKNPTGGIPVLELDDGSCISESVAICRYFEELHPDPPLFGTGAKEKAIVDMWLRRVELNLMVPIGMVWVHGHPLTAKLIQQIPEAAAQNRVRTAMGYKLLNDQLARHAFIAGDTYTVADAVALATVDFGAGLVGVPPDAALTHLDRWHQAVTARPSAKA